MCSFPVIQSDENELFEDWGVKLQAVGTPGPSAPRFAPGSDPGSVLEHAEDAEGSTVTTCVPPQLVMWGQLS